MCTYFNMLSFAKSIKLSFYVYGSDYIEYDNDFYYNDSQNNRLLISENGTARVVLLVCMIIMILMLLLMLFPIFFLIFYLLQKYNEDSDDLLVKKSINYWLSFTNTSWTIAAIINIICVLFSMLFISFLSLNQWMLWLCCLFSIGLAAWGSDSFVLGSRSNILFAYSLICLFIISLCYIIFFGAIVGSNFSLAQSLRDSMNMMCIILWSIWGALVLLFFSMLIHKKYYEYD